MPLTPVDEEDFGIAFMEPNVANGWTLQGMMDRTRQKFPTQFVKSSGLVDTKG